MTRVRRGSRLWLARGFGGSETESLGSPRGWIAWISMLGYAALCGLIYLSR